MKIVFAGQMAGASRILRSVLESEHEITRVLVPKGESYRMGNVAHIAESRGIQVDSGAKLKYPAFATELQKADLFLNVLSPFEVCTEVLAAPRIGSFNVHPSLLPRYAGLTPTSFAIFHGEKEHGVTLHWMVPEIDAGPIISQKQFPIEDSDTPVTLLRKAFEGARRMVSDFLDLAARDPLQIPRSEQDRSMRKYFSREDYPNTEIFWDDPATYIYGLWKASNYWPSVCPWGELRATLGAIPAVVLGMELVGEHSFPVKPGTMEWSERGVRVAAGGQWILVTRAKVNDTILSGKELSAYYFG